MAIIHYILYITASWSWSFLYFALLHKPLFGLINNRSAGGRIRPKDVAEVYRHGLRSDAIVSCYLTAIPLIAGLARCYFPGLNLAAVIMPYNILISLAIGLLVIADTALYTFWNSKIDASVFAYLRSLKGAFASVSGGYIAGATTATLLWSAMYFCGAQTVGYFCGRIWAAGPTDLLTGIGAAIAALIMLAGMFVIIRGLKIRPNNPSIAYYSPIAFFNHWALNPGYNIIYTVGKSNDFKGQFEAFDPEECDEICREIFPTAGTPRRQLLRHQRPNILTIVWESFGAEFCGAAGGRSDVTPNIDRLAAEGVLFTNCRASSFRTDRALPAIFCGLPGQPTTSIVRYARKLPALPAFPRDLRDAGYDTTAIHGGDLTIMHKSDFYLSAGHSRLIAEKDFPTVADKGKWGVHDGPVLDYVTERILAMKPEEQPWLITVQTLSSHEPFEVPYARLSDRADNSMAYTDSAIGRMVERLKATPVWDNLLIIIVADHGLNRSDTPANRSDYSHIPLLMLGGAVKEPAVIDTLMCQTDIAATLLGQLSLPHDHYPFSRDILADSYRIPTAMHTYPNGFLFTDTEGYTDFDNVGKRVTAGTADPSRMRRGKAILQKLYSYIDSL